MDESSSVDARIGARLKMSRAAERLSLGQLADRAGVSRSMISLIERGESSPTANILDKLAAALGVTIGFFFAQENDDPPAPLVRRAEQPVWKDPLTGYVRRDLSPAAFGAAMQLVEVSLPAGARVALDSGQRQRPLDQTLWVLEGSLEVHCGGASHRLEEGDCLAMHVDGPTAFANQSAGLARYLVAIVAEPATGRQSRERAAS